MDTSDAAAYALLERIARKAAEPMSDDSDPDKTVGEWRKELAELHTEAMFFVRARSTTKPALDLESSPPQSPRE